MKSCFYQLCHLWQLAKKKTDFLLQKCISICFSIFNRLKTIFQHSHTSCPLILLFSTARHFDTNILWKWVKSRYSDFTLGEKIIRWCVNHISIRWLGLMFKKNIHFNLTIYSWDPFSYSPLIIIFSLIDKNSHMRREKRYEMFSFLEHLATIIK